MKAPKQKKQLNKQLKAHYQQHSLSELQLEKLQNLSVNNKPSLIKPLLAVAASSLLALSLYIVNFTGLNYGDISEEIAYNHNSQMQMEVFSESIDGIQSHLNRLGFSLIESAQLAGESWQLVGGRYCSISGKIAAQLKIKNLNTLKTYTFYQAKLPEKFFNIIQDKEIFVDGVSVKMWQENGLLMGLAK
ncbi:MAG: hypothetical protein GY951_08265 [Psychromonas sp.]|nr:hypothetical protein [Alteromonadales bacterium]MCP5078031.1 hypothetical protein [Psychromonas sp.]